MSDNTDIVTLSFEQALSKLETVVRKMESGEAPLEDAISMYEEGMKLKAHCEKKLAEAKMRVDKIVVSGNGAPDVQPFETAEQ